MSELYEYISKFLSIWWPIVTAGSLFGVDEFSRHYWKWLKNKLDLIPENWRRSAEIVFFVCAVFYAGFAAWREDHKELEILKPKAALAEERQNTIESQDEKIKELESKIADFQSKPQKQLPVNFTVNIPQLEKWKLSHIQIDELNEAINNSPKKLTFSIVTVPGAPSDAVSFGYDLMHIFGGMNGRKGESWLVNIVTVDGYHSPDDVGLKIDVAVDNDPTKNENAQILKEIFGKAKIETSFSMDGRLHGNDVLLVIGKQP